MDQGFSKKVLLMKTNMDGGKVFLNLANYCNILIPLVYI
jgi:hypothetical protein